MVVRVNRVRNSLPASHFLVSATVFICVVAIFVGCAALNTVENNTLNVYAVLLKTTDGYLYFLD